LCGSGVLHSYPIDDFLMKFPRRTFSVLCVLCISVVSCFSLDREAFTFTNYDLHVRIEPEQQRLGVRGKITLRNDSSIPQKIVILQISSSLDWRAITIGGKVPEFVRQRYTSDIDHTGVLSEMIVTLPQEIAPRGTVDLDIGYEGVITQDATRLTRIGTPGDAAKSSDWDQISTNFTGVRGIGYVAWYPIATESTNLSDGDTLFEVLGHWKQREMGSRMKVTFEYPDAAGDSGGMLICSGAIQQSARGKATSCDYGDISRSAPTFAAADYGTVRRGSITVFNFPMHAVTASAYADVAQGSVPVITNWFGAPRERLQVADLSAPDAAPFGSGSLLLTPLGSNDSPPSGLAAVYQMAHVAFWSPRPWIDQGLAHFAQALYLEQEKGRRVALDYMATHRGGLVQVEGASYASESSDQANSLINTNDEIYMQSKAMAVWWMLREMIGETALKKAISLYRPEYDRDPTYMPKLIQAQTQRDLSPFFDEWVYRDRGLPDFKVESAFAAKTVNGTFMVTVTVDNLGAVGAEVPMIVKFPGGEMSRRLEVQAKNRATIRVETPAAPEKVLVNDGSVPESDTGNNTFSFETQSSSSRQSD
jgi:hypothetical protein